MTDAEKKEDPAVVEDDDKEEEIKKELTTEDDDSETIKAVAERLKFFFSDANVRQDFFMRNLLMETDEKKECSVPVQSLLSFNTIKKLTTDPEIVAKAVKEHLSDKLEMKDDGKAVARVKPFTKAILLDNIPLSLYITNLPVKDEEGYNGKKIVVYDVTMDEIRALFETYGEVSLVKMRFKSSAFSKDDNHTDDIKMEEKESGGRKPRRRYPLRSCMVEFENLEAHAKAAEDVLTLKEGEKVEPKRKLELKGKTLEVMTLQDYLDSLKKRKRARDEDDDDDNKNKKPKQENNDAADKFTINWKPGCVVSLKGLPDTCDREAIVEAVMKACDITKDEAKKNNLFVDYSRGKTDGAIRFDKPELASKTLEKLKSGDVKICETKIEEASLLEGDGEKKYWDDFIEFKKKQMRHRGEERKYKHNNHHNNKKRKGGRKGGYQTLQS